MAIWNKLTQAFLPDNKTLFEAFMLADKDGNIINSFGAASNVIIAAGLVDGYSHINKFGATPGDVTAGTVWDGNVGTTVYPYPANGVVSVASATNSGDDVEIQGLNAAYEPVTETVAIGASGTETFSRVFRASMVDTNNTSDVIINMGASPAAYIKANLGQTLMAVYTIPAGKTGYLLKANFGSDKASTNSAMGYSIMARPFGGTFNIKGRFYSAGGQNIVQEYPIPLKFDEKTDIRIDITAAQQATIAATFDIILVDNPA